MGTVDSQRPGDIGAFVRARRQAAGLTQQQLADRAGVSVASVRDLEQGRVGRPRSAPASRLADALRLDRLQRIDFAYGLRPRIRGAGSAAPAAAPRAAMGGRGESGAITAALRISVLGPLTVWRDGAEVPLGRNGQRAVLGLLAVYANTPVPRERIVEALWGDRSPQAAVSTIQTHISRLRSLLDPRRRGCRGCELIPAGAGCSYRLQVTGDQLDLFAFERLVTAARASRKAEDSAAACGSYAAALALWRGEPLADVSVLQGHPAVTGLAEHRAAIVMEFAAAACCIGWHDEAVPHLRALAADDPLNERVHARLMIALAGSGRQAEALRIYDSLRRRLDELLGVLPGAELADAQVRVLRHELAGT